jgi:hypothetical protein
MQLKRQDKLFDAANVSTYPKTSLATQLPAARAFSAFVYEYMSFSASMRSGGGSIRGLRN